MSANNQLTKKQAEICITNFMEIAESNSGLAVIDMTEAERTLKLAIATSELHNALDDNTVSALSKLQGKDYGFKSDKYYPVNTVRDAIVSAVLWGARLTNNEFNIIANNFYAAKNFWKRKAEEMTNGTILLDMQLPTITPLKNSKLSKAEISWTATGLYQGNEFERSGIERIKVFDGSGGGDDQAKGKAEKRAYEKVCKYLNASYNTTPSADVEPKEFIESKTINGGTGGFKEGRNNSRKASNNINRNQLIENCVQAGGIFEKETKEFLGNAGINVNDSEPITPEIISQLDDTVLQELAEYQKDIS